jgi:xanthine dehydrogenase accessory factor
MQELSRILEAYGESASPGVTLATIVRISGSSYRQPGAHMLILPDGTTIGSISGGCLEEDVIIHARNLRARNESAVLTYDTTSEEDVVFGVGLGCKGVIEILVEPAGGSDNPANVDRMLAFLRKASGERRTAVVATVFRVGGTLQERIGARHASGHSGVEFSGIQDPELRDRIAADSFEALRTGRSVTARYEVKAGTADVFIHVIHPPAALYIFGAGYDAMPLSRLAKELGFHVTVADRRPAYATRERFPEADGVMILRPEEIAGLDLNGRTAAVIMSHHYETDRSCLKALLGAPLRYLGLMGPRKRAEKMLQEFREAGMPPGKAALENFHNPVGLDIGAETPAQIALAIVSEIQAVLSEHPAGFLRKRQGPVHARNAAAV